MSNTYNQGLSQIELTNKKVVVIGGSSGQGLATARRLVDAGAKVIIASRSEKKLHSAKEFLGHNVLEIYSIDITIEQDIKKFIEHVGKFDHLVFTAAGISVAPILEQSVADARMLFETKFWGPYYAAKYSIPYLNESSSITMFSGAAGVRPVPGLGVFGAVDGAVESLVRAMSWEFRPIRVNAVSPGFMATPLFDFIPKQERDAMFAAAGAMLPARRMGRPDDTAQAAIFLIQNGYTTGQVFYVDGGHSQVEYSDLVSSGGKS